MAKILNAFAVPIVRYSFYFIKFLTEVGYAPTINLRMIQPSEAL
jgi:hypothetical protein